MDAQPKSPKITHLSWGHLEVEEGNTYKDAKLWPGGSGEWDWTETGTSHTPGVQPEDLEEILEHGAQTVVLSRGMNRRLQVQQRTLEWLRSQGIRTYVLQTEEAVAQYNQLAENEPVGALIHSTC